MLEHIAWWVLELRHLMRAEARVVLLFILIALMVGMILVVVALIGLIRVIIFAAPFALIIGVAVYATLRHRSRRAQAHAALDAIADRERKLNRQEFDAWSSSVEQERRNAARRQSALRRLTRARQTGRKPDRDQ